MHSRDEDSCSPGPLDAPELRKLHIYTTFVRTPLQTREQAWRTLDKRSTHKMVQQLPLLLSGELNADQL